MQKSFHILGRKENIGNVVGNLEDDGHSYWVPTNLWHTFVGPIPLLVAAEAGGTMSLAIFWKDRPIHGRNDVSAGSRSGK